MDAMTIKFWARVPACRFSVPLGLNTVRLGLGLVAGLLGAPPAHADSALAMGYDPKYPPSFQQFDYVNPAAPKGGRLVLAAQGSFDSLNPFTLKGDKEAGLGSLLFDTLAEKSLDEPFSMYGLLAEDISLAANGLSVTFRLRPQAKFSDGSRVTAADVKHSFNTLTTDRAAHPRYRFYWGDVKSATVLDSRTVRFDFKRRNAELHLILGELPVFSRQWGGGKPLAERVLTPPLASGPYIIDRYRLGKETEYRRRPDYWAKDLPIRRGQFNFDRVLYRYMMDDTVRLEAFKAGEFDVSAEHVAKLWARGYVGERFDQKRILKREVPHGNGAGMQGFAMNMRRPLFADVRVRQALTLAFDFDWANRKLFYGQYVRSQSYFSNSEMAASGLPDADERALLTPYRRSLSPAVFGPAVTAPDSATPEALRRNLREAQHLLYQAGWRLKDGHLVNAQGQPFRFEFLTFARTYERIVAPYQRNLRKLGIEVDMRIVDPAIFQQRMNQFDYDMSVVVFGQSASPGNELLDYFSSAAADRPGSNNSIGLKNKAVDALLEQILDTDDRDELVTLAKALDRILRAGYYLVPNWHLAYHRIAYWDKFNQPATLPVNFSAQDWVLRTWWAKAPTVLTAPSPSSAAKALP